MAGDLEGLLRTFGYFALYGFVFAESGLFFGLFLPGDSLLFTAGLLSAKGFLDIYAVVLGSIVFAFLGDQVGYWTGEKFGSKFFDRPGDLFRDPKHIKRAKAFYEKHGRKMIVLARFVPAVRTFAPIFAGTAGMDYKTFTAYNALGGILWVAGFSLAGYYLGTVIPEEFMTAAILAIIAISFVPIAWEYYRENPGIAEKAVARVKKLANSIIKNR